MTKQYSMMFLLEMVQKTQMIDESGDATMTAYTDELVLEGKFDGQTSLHDFYVGFLTWANGPNWEQFLRDAKVGDIPSHKAERRQDVHAFDSTGDAYDACQCDTEIENGDTLIIEPEGVVGLAGTWPVAVTKTTGKLHWHLADHPVTDETGTEEQIRKAVKYAVDMNLEIAVAFLRFK